MEKVYICFLIKLQSFFESESETKMIKLRKNGNRGRHKNDWLNYFQFNDLFHRFYFHFKLAKDMESLDLDISKSLR